MKKFVFIAICLLAATTLHAANLLTFDNVEIATNGTATINAYLENQTDVAGFQFDMKLPEGLSVVTNSRGKMVFTLNAERIEDHVVTSNVRPTGVVSVIAYSASAEPFYETNGQILSFQIVAGENYSGIHDIEISDIIISTRSGEKVQTSGAAVIKVKGPSADNANRLTFGNVEITAGSVATVNAFLDNQADVAGFQFDMKLPEGISVVTNSRGKMVFTLNADRIEDHVVTSNVRSTGVVSVIAYSASAEPFYERSGQILSFQIIASENYTGSHNIEISDITISTSAGQKVQTSGAAIILVKAPSLTGDVNGDNQVDVSDINALVNVLLGKDTSAQYDGRTDVTGDDIIDVSDINALINIILGK